MFTISYYYRDSSRSTTGSSFINFSSVDYSNYNDENNINKPDNDISLNADDTVILLRVDI